MTLVQNEIPALTAAVFIVCAVGCEIPWPSKPGTSPCSTSTECVDYEAEQAKNPGRARIVGDEGAGASFCVAADHTDENGYDSCSILSCPNIGSACDRIPQSICVALDQAGPNVRSLFTEADASTSIGFCRKISCAVQTDCPQETVCYKSFCQPTSPVLK